MKYFLILLFFIASCERDRPPVLPVHGARSLQLFLFAAGFCGPCKEELPLIQKWHDRYQHNSAVTPTVYFIAGNPASKPASQEDAEAFTKSLGVMFSVKADKYARFYRMYFKHGTQVPATVIADESGAALKLYSGVVSVELLERDAETLLKNERKK